MIRNTNVAIKEDLMKERLSLMTLATENVGFRNVFWHDNTLHEFNSTEEWNVHVINNITKHLGRMSCYAAQTVANISKVLL